ncbi:hypothetical protein [Kocuria marina]|uniref:hypothetical protein n=1 Tax=Kocuria marina TaxID=223184 RepID=UPI0034616F4E
MSSRYEKNSDPASLRKALQQREAQFAMAPSFDTIRHRIAATPTLDSCPSWTSRRSLVLTVALVRAQMRIVPWLILPVALATGALAALSARFLAAAQSSSFAVSGFSSMMLFGVAITLTMAVSGFRADSVSLVTPLGPRAVLLARVVIVLAVDCLAGIGATGAVVAGGFPAPFLTILLSWLLPLTAVTGAVTFIAVWTSPWAAAVVGSILIPLVGPRPETDAGVFGLGSLMGVLQEAVTPVGVLAIGAAVLIAAVLSARPAVSSGLVPA